MTIIDISWPLTLNVTGYKNRTELSFTALKSFGTDKVRLSSCTLNAHAGTHVDAPSHFLAHGDSIESFSLEQLCGRAQVIDLTMVEDSITAAHLQSFSIKKDEIVLLKTRNSSLPPTGSFAYDFVYLSQSGAAFLQDMGVKAVRIDYLGIERDQPNHQTHTILLQAHIPIIEGLRLASVVPGWYTLYCLPLALHGIEAAPARAILVTDCSK